jgi:ATP-binding cassette subfamily B protein
MNLDALLWPRERLGDAVEALSARAGFQTQRVALQPPLPGLTDEALVRYAESAADSLGIESAPVDVPWPEAEALVRGARPALLLRPDGILCLLRRGFALDPALREVRVAESSVCGWLRAGAERKEGPAIDRLLDAAGLAGGVRRRTRAALLRERLAKTPLGGCLLLRRSPGDQPRELVKAGRLVPRLVMTGILSTLFLAGTIASWAVLTRGALGGRLEPGWMAAWVLVRLVLVPLFMARDYVAGALAIDVTAALKARLMLGALKLDPHETRAEGAGKFLGRALEAERFESIGVNALIGAVDMAVMLLISGTVLALGPGGLLEVAALAISCGLMFWFARRVAKARRVWAQARLSITDELVERMEGHRTRLVQEDASNWHDDEDRSLGRYAELSLGMDQAYLRFVAIAPRAYLLMAVLGLAPSFIAGAEAGPLALSFVCMLNAFELMRQYAESALALADAAIAWEKIRPLFDAAARPVLLTSPDLASSPPPADATLLEARDLRFRHTARVGEVLRGSTLRIGRGERLLLEGPSGSGKSTLASLVSGLRAPDAGVLLLDGLDLRSWGESGWRGRVACAPQFHENHVLTGPFSFNLLMGRDWPAPQQDLDEAEQLCRELELGPLLERMPAGLGQMVGETGWQLSHGERSRLYLARALLQKAELVVLDESFAALDPATFRMAMECARRRAKSLLVIAHP